MSLINISFYFLLIVSFYFSTVASSLNLKVISILALVTILAISRTSAVCCNDPSYTLYHKCANLPVEVSKPSAVTTTSWYSKTEPDWKNPKPEDGDICYSQFCEDGTEKSGNCGIGGLFCDMTGCTCSDCRRKKELSYEEMKKAWAIKHSFTTLCDGTKETCAKV